MNVIKAKKKLDVTMEYEVNKMKMFNESTNIFLLQIQLGKIHRISIKRYAFSWWWYGNDVARNASQEI